MAENSKAIDSIHSKLETMSSLLTQVVGRFQPPLPTEPLYDTEAEDIAHEGPSRATPTRSRHRSDFILSDTYHNSRHRHNSIHSCNTSGRAPDMSRMPRRAAPYTRAPALDPLGSRSTHPPRREMPTSLHDLDESAELQDHVAHLISATLAPSHLSGKKAFAHSYVRRGPKKSRTTLGELSQAEYNLGFIRLMNSREVDPADRPFMFQHLEHLNEDAITFPFTDVRAWSEEVCFLVSEGELAWDDHYRIDLLRLKHSQNGPGSKDQREQRDPRDTRRQTDSGAIDPLTELSADVRAARPAPPCRLYNSTGCSHRSHHVANGLRQLHVCSSCVYHKCLLLPHAEKDCKAKEFRKRHVARDAEPGFGK